MAGEDVGGSSRTRDDPLEGWLDEKAEELGLSREELLAYLQNGDEPADRDQLPDDDEPGGRHRPTVADGEPDGRDTADDASGGANDASDSPDGTSAGTDAASDSPDGTSAGVDDDSAGVDDTSDGTDDASAGVDDTSAGTDDDSAGTDDDSDGWVWDGTNDEDGGRAGGNASGGVSEDEIARLQREFAERLESVEGEFETELADVRAELADVEGDFDGKIQDVRERVIQVKRETDEKALANHDHADLRRQTEDVAERTGQLAAELEALSETVAELESLSETVAELESMAETVAELESLPESVAELESMAERVEELEATADTVGELETQVETGFENFEDVLEYLTDATDDLEAKLTTLAEVVVQLRDQTQRLSARHASRAAADELAHLANRRGVKSAKCSHCGETVHVGLLAEPNCPHCASTFNDVEPKQGLFGSARLLVGDPPALEGERADWDVGSVMDADAADLSDALEEIIGEDGE